jgi:ATP-dependent Clp protease ATP-binding subunit ClpC
MSNLPTILYIDYTGNNRYRYQIRKPDESIYFQKVWEIEVDHRVIERLCKDIDRKLDRLNSGPIDDDGYNELKRIGRTLYDQLLPEESCADLRELLKSLNTPLLISTNDPQTYWELIYDGDEFWGVKYPIGRTVWNKPVPNTVPWQKRKRQALFIVNPNGEDELMPAEKETDKFLDWLKAQGIECKYLTREDATLTNVLNELGSGDYEIIYYLGHIKLDDTRGEYGFVLNDEEILCTSVVRRSAKGTPFVFLNGCRSANVVKVKSLADAFIDAKAMLVIGTICDVPENGARKLAERFFELALSGNLIGEALTTAKKEILNPTFRATWASFIMYGDPCLKIKEDIVTKALREIGLKRNDFDSSCMRVIEECIEYARPTGQIATPHLFLAMLRGTDDRLRDGLREQKLKPEILEEAFRRIFTLAKRFQKETETLEDIKWSENTPKILHLAKRIAEKNKHEEIKEEDMLCAFVRQGGGSTGRVLQRIGVDWTAIAGEICEDKDLCREFAERQLSLGPLKRDECDSSAWYIIKRSIEAACRSGSDTVGTPHLFLAMLDGEEGCLSNALSRQGVSHTKVKQLFRQMMSPQGEANLIETIKCSENTKQILLLAKKLSLSEKREKVTETDLLSAFVQQGGGETGKFLQNQLGIDLLALTSQLFLEDGEIDIDRFDETGKEVLKATLDSACERGDKIVATPHLFAGLSSLEGGITQALLLNQGVDPQEVKDTITGIVEKERDITGYIKPALSLSCLSARLIRILSKADTLCKSEGADGITERHLLLAFLSVDAGETENALRSMGVSLSTMKHCISLAKDGSIKITTTPLLDKLGRDITKEAKEGRLRPVIGREEEIQRIATILSRQTKNAPLLVGEAGVGKTAAVEGLAQQIISTQELPKTLKDLRIIEISVSRLVAGTKYRGDFEQRMERLIKEAKQENIVLFIDEIHTLVGAGSAGGGSLDAGNILKPTLASGEIRCIGATTMDEYRRYIEPDSALSRRFQLVQIEEPTQDEAVEILKGLRDNYEEHYGLKITDEAIKAAVKLSISYLTDRHLPDKACDVIEEACASAQIKKSRGKSKKIIVTGEDIAQVISQMVPGIQVGKITEDEQAGLLDLEDRLKHRVIGQDEAISIVAQTVRSGRANLKDANRPIAVFIFAGSTGVGKTELAKALAEALFGSEECLIRLDMSEFMEPHSVSKLIGAPPRYVGYKEGGQLTKPLRWKPHSIVLLDEIENAHPEILQVFLQLFGEGRITDTQGHTVSGKNAIFIMTTNITAKSEGKVGFGKAEETQKRVKSQVVADLKKVFSPEFFNRIDEVIVFNNLNKEDIRTIITRQLNSITEQVMKEHRITVKIEESAIDYLVEKGYDPNYGARAALREIDKEIRKPLSTKIVEGKLKVVIITVDGDRIKFLTESR